MAASAHPHPLVPEAAQRSGAVLFSWAVFPVAFVGSLALSIVLVERTGSQLLALLAGLAVGYGIVLVGERVYPFVSDWSRNHDDVPTDAAWFGSTVAIGSLVTPGMTALGGWLGAGLSERLGSQLWPRDWSLAAQLALALVVVEFFQYWMHRFGHEVDLLWRLHATHHSAPRLYWLNASRFHALEIVLLNAGFIVPLVALGAGPSVFMLWIVASSVHGICQHANMQIRCGLLNWIFSMSELHRWHHSDVLRESNTNYGLNLIVWDILFRTRVLPADREAPEGIGISGLSAFPMTWWAQICSPLHWARIKRESAAKTAV